MGNPVKKYIMLNETNVSTLVLALHADCLGYLMGVECLVCKTLDKSKVRISANRIERYNFLIFLLFFIVVKIIRKDYQA